MSNHKYIIENYLGKTINGQTVIGEAPSIPKQRRWLIRCQCGVERSLAVVNLMKKWPAQCLECQKKAQSGPKAHNWKGGRHVPLTHYNKFKNCARKRGIEWALTIEDIDHLYEKQRGLCAMSEVPLQFDHGPNNGVLKGNASLDRIDSKKGYVLGNVHLVTKAVNIGKQSMSYEAFVTMCFNVTNRHLV